MKIFNFWQNCIKYVKKMEKIISKEKKPNKTTKIVKQKKTNTNRKKQKKMIAIQKQVTIQNKGQSYNAKSTSERERTSKQRT